MYIFSSISRLNLRRESSYCMETGNFLHSQCLNFDILTNWNRAWSAVCRGATHWGLERCHSSSGVIKAPIIGSRRSRLNYGVIRASSAGDGDEFPFSVTKGSQIDWLLKKVNEYSLRSMAHLGGGSADDYGDFFSLPLNNKWLTHSRVTKS